MIKTRSHTENCTSCVHYGYCMVYWGADCKRQGGRRIPRMKPTPVDILEKTAQSRTEQVQVGMHKPDFLASVGKHKFDKSKNTQKPELFKKFGEIFEPIKSQVANR